MKIFTTGFIQVFFVAINTIFLSRSIYLGVAICGFIISLIWTYNVMKISISTLKDRLLYATGASMGSLFGLIISENLLKII